MELLFNKKYFFLKKQTGLLSVTQRYDVYDAETHQQLIMRHETGPETLKNILRFIGYTASIPFTIHITDINKNPLFVVERKFSFFRPAIKVIDSNQKLRGIIMRSAWWSFFADQFKIMDADGNKRCGFNENLYSFSKGDTEFAHLHGSTENLRANLIDVTDQYKLEFKDAADDAMRIMIFGVIMSIDFLVKHRTHKKPLNGKSVLDI